MAARRSAAALLLVGLLCRPGVAMADTLESLIEASARNPVIRRALALLADTGVTLRDPVVVLNPHNPSHTAWMSPADRAALRRLGPQVHALRWFDREGRQPQTPIILVRNAGPYGQNAYEAAASLSTPEALSFLASTILHEAVHAQEPPRANDALTTEYAARALQADWLRHARERGIRVSDAQIEAVTRMAADLRRRLMARQTVAPPAGTR